MGYGNRRFSPGDTIQIGGKSFSVTTYICYRGGLDGATWYEYRLDSNGTIYWFVDDPSIGFELSQTIPKSDVPDDSVLIEKGHQQVIDCGGGFLDVENGDAAAYEDYIDANGNTFSMEIWDDEIEYSIGRRIPAKDIFVNGNPIAPRTPIPEEELLSLDMALDTRRFSVGQQILINNDLFSVTSIVKYQNVYDGAIWEEYIAYSPMNGTRRFTYDPTMGYQLLNPRSDIEIPTGFQQLENGEQIVREVQGDIEISVGDRLTYTDYINLSGAVLTVLEGKSGANAWDGAYVPVQFIRAFDGTFSMPEDAAKNNKDKETFASRHKGVSGVVHGPGLTWIITIVITAVITLAGIGLATCSSSDPEFSLHDYITGTSAYTQVSSIADSNGEEITVYSHDGSIEDVAKDIISGVEGDIDSTDGDATKAAINEDDDFVVVYPSSENGKTLVMLASRKAMYADDTQPYQMSDEVYSWMRDYYWTTCYEQDQQKYSDTTSRYSTHHGRYIVINSGNGYRGWADSARQESINSRKSSGGGISSGK